MRNAARVPEPRGAELQLVRDALAAPCTHEGEVSVHVSCRDLSDHETAYGRCLSCKAWVRRETWFSRDRDASVETDLMTAREVEALDVVEGQFWSADQ